MHMHGKLLVPAAAKHPDMAVPLFPALASQIPGSLVLVPCEPGVGACLVYTSHPGPQIARYSGHRSKHPVS